MKKLISLITAVFLSLSCVITAVAATQFSDGIYTFEQNSYGNAVITDCDLTEENIEVPMFVLDTPVVEIGDYAFFSNSYIQSIALPDTVIAIGEYAFADDPGLQSVSIPRWCEKIADNAFWNSPNVTICCYTDSEAQRFAEERGIPYILIGAPAEKTDISKAKITLEETAVRYNGTEHTPEATVTLGETILSRGTDYSLKYSDNTDPGEAVVTVTGIGSYEGEALAHFDICNVLGDTDGNGETEAADATLVQRHLIYMPVPNAERVETVGDINADGLDVADATFIQRYSVKISVPYPIDEIMTGSK